MTIQPGDIVLGKCPTGTFYFDVVRSVFEQTDSLGRTYPAAVLTRRSWAPLTDLMVAGDLTAEGGAIISRTLVDDKSEIASEAWDRAYRTATGRGETPEVASRVGDLAYQGVIDGEGVETAIDRALRRLR